MDAARGAWLLVSKMPARNRKQSLLKTPRKHRYAGKKNSTTRKTTRTAGIDFRPARPTRRRVNDLLTDAGRAGLTKALSPLTPAGHSLPGGNTQGAGHDRGQAGER